MVGTAGTCKDSKRHWSFYYSCTPETKRMDSNVRDLAARTRLDYPSIEAAFPEADAKLRPYHNLVLVQIRSPKEKTAGGIILPTDTKETEIWNTQVAKVIA